MRKILLFFLMLISLFISACKNKDILLAGFEGENFGEWKAEGEAFGTGPVKVQKVISKTGVVTGQRGVGQSGLGYIGTMTQNPGSKGILISPVFRANRKYLVFLFGSTKNPDLFHIDLISDGRVIESLIGNNESVLEWKYFDLSDIRGRRFQIRISGSSQPERRMGQLMADNFYLSNQLPLIEKTLDFTISKRYINLPVRPGDRKKQVKLSIDGKFYDYFSIELADSVPEYYVFIDMEKYAGKKALIFTPNIPRDSKAIDFISNDNEIKGIENLYNEPHRQQFHFSSRRGWNNDPNGLVFYKGVYHLYYQHNPYGSGWGNMHWGHAVSKDLVHWTELKETVYPVHEKDAAFSGSAAMDFMNTTGFKTGNEDVMVAAYTSTGRGECLLYSTDAGLSFNEYPGNPVLKHPGRDPKIIWYEPGKYWIIVVYDETDKNRSVNFYTSGDLKEWKFQCKVEGLYECPEFFELKVNGTNTKKWILYGASGAYFIGSFDGKVFKPESELIPNNYGNCFYASQTFNNIPENDGRRIQIGWGLANSPGEPFNQCMLFPTRLSLRNTKNGVRMFTEPVKELELLHKKEWLKENLVIEPGDDPLSGMSGELYHIKSQFKIGKNTQLGFKIHGTEVIYDASKAELSCMGKKTELKLIGGRIYFEILVDRNTIEIFGNHGEVYMPVARDLKKPYGVQFICRNEKVTAERMQIFELESIWK
jgi:fructan beta-fructosidase